MLYIFSILLFLNPGDGKWVSYFKNPGIEIFYKKTDCIDTKNGISQSKVLFRFQNLTQKKLEVTFSKKLVYTSGNKDNQTASDNAVYKLNLSPGSDVEATCEDRDKTLYIFEKFLDKKGPELKSFDLENIKIKEID